MSLEIKPKQEAFDLLLLPGDARRANEMLCITKYLSKEMKIGIAMLDTNPGAISKRGFYRRDLFQRCIRNGAEHGGSWPMKAKVAIVGPDIPPEHHADRLTDVVKADRILGFATAWHASGPREMNWRAKFRPDRVLVTSENLYKNHFTVFARHPPPDDMAVTQYGFPYKKYPIFPNFSADYAVAIPSALSLPTLRERRRFLRMVLRLFKAIRREDKDDGETSIIAYKPHNGLEHDRIDTWGVFDLLSRVKHRTVQIEDGFYNLEAFMPGIHRGIIGGLCNTILGAHYHRLPYFNCVDPVRWNRKACGKSTKHLEENLKYCGVPFCEGQLWSDEAYFDIVSDQMRSADLIEIVRAEVHRG